jgi:hypothetical protein
MRASEHTDAYVQKPGERGLVDRFLQEAAARESGPEHPVEGLLTGLGCR